MRRTAEDTAATRAALLDAALHEFAERGVATATLAGVAARAGLTRGAVYHHFADKAALHFAVMAESWDTISADVWTVLDAPDRPLRDRLPAFVDAWLEALRSDARFQALMAVSMQAGPPATAASTASQASGYQAWLEHFVTALTREPDELAADIDPRTAAVHLFAWLCGLCLVADTTPALLPTADATGVAPFLRGLLR